MYKFIYNGYDKNNSNTDEYDCCIYNYMVFMIKSHSCSLCYVCNLNCRVYKSFLRSDFIKTKNRVDQIMIIMGNVY